MRLAADVYGVPAEELEQLLENIGAAAGDGGRHDRGRSDESGAVETGKQLLLWVEEEGEAEGEIVGGVAWAGEDGAGDLEFAVADGDEDAFLEELGC